MGVGRGGKGYGRREGVWEEGGGRERREWVGRGGNGYGRREGVGEEGGGGGEAGRGMVGDTHTLTDGL